MPGWAWFGLGIATGIMVVSIALAGHFHRERKR